MPDHLDRFLDELDLDVDLDTNRLSRAEVAQLASIRRLIQREGASTMASLDNLTAVIATLNQDVTTAAADVTAAIDALKQQIADLSVGAITQDQIDALTASVTDADTAVDALDASVKPAP